MNVELGSTVLYTLSEGDASEINRRRTTGAEINTLMVGEWPRGAQAHIGIPAHAGQQYPMVVTRAMVGGVISGQILLEGNDVYWATLIGEGTQPGTWAFRPEDLVQARLWDAIAAWALRDPK